VPCWAELVAGLAIDHRVTVFPLRLPVGDRPFRLYGADVVPLAHGLVPLRRSPALWADAVRAIVQQHGRQSFDVLYAVQANESGFVGALASVATGVPLVAHIGGGELVGLPDFEYGSQLIALERAQVALTLRRARALTVGSRAMQQVARAALGAGHSAVHWAPFGVDPARFAPTPFPDRPSLVHVADLNPVKDQPTLLAAFALARTAVPGVRLNMIGGGRALKGLRRLAGALGVAEHIRWWGQVPHAAMPHAYSGASAFALSSRHEAQAVVLAEAAACGLPIAATAVGMAPDLPPAATHLAAPGDTEHLAAAMLAALEPGPSRVDGRDALRAAAIAQYSLEVCTQRIAAILHAEAGRRA
jgi:glycosyltransferase involved in cell wall biosynthesis